LCHGPAPLNWRWVDDRLHTAYPLLPRNRRRNPLLLPSRGRRSGDWVYSGGYYVL